MPEENKFLFKKTQKIKNFKPTLAYYYGDVFGFDLADYTGQESGANRGYMVVVIDYFTRYAWTRVIQHKSKSEIHNALQSIFEEAGTKPVNIHTDRESGLIHNGDLEGINVYHTDGLYGQGGAPIVERLIRTLREKLEQHRDVAPGRQWKKFVPQVTNEYNNSKHRTLNMSPQEARDHPDDTTRIQEEIATTRPKETKILDEDANVVVAKAKKNIFEKGFKRKWDTNVLTIEDVITSGGGPVTYLLSDGKKYYKQQLQVLNDAQVDFLTKKNRNRASNSMKSQIATRSHTEPMKKVLRSGKTFQ